MPVVFPAVKPNMFIIYGAITFYPEGRFGFISYSNNSVKINIWDLSKFIKRFTFLKKRSKEINLLLCINSYI